MTRRYSSVTIRDVARQAGVSVATVSRFINRNAPVSAEVAERLKQVLTELRYVPHAAARNLASRKTRVIGLLLNNLCITNPLTRRSSPAKMLFVTARTLSTVAVLR